MRIDRGLLNWGVFLIALGGVPLAVQQGWASEGIAADLWRLWPLILVGIGLGLMLRWTPLAWLGGALVAGTFGLIFGALFAGGIPGISSACIGPGDQDAVVSEETGIAATGTFRLDVSLSCGELSVSRESGAAWTLRAEHAPDIPPTIEGSSAGLSIVQEEDGGLFPFGQRTRNVWDIGLPVAVPIAADLTLNAADGEVDLGVGALESLSGTFNATDIDLVLADATAEAAQLDLTFNATSGRLSLPDGSVLGNVTLNASSLEICAPQSAEIRVDLESTLSSDDFDDAGLTQRGDGWQTEGYDAAGTRIQLSLTSTVSSISFTRAEVCP